MSPAELLLLALVAALGPYYYLLEAPPASSPAVLPPDGVTVPRACHTYSAQASGRGRRGDTLCLGRFSVPTVALRPPPVGPRTLGSRPTVSCPLGRLLREVEDPRSTARPAGSASPPSSPLSLSPLSIFTKPSTSSQQSSRCRAPSLVTVQDRHASRPRVLRWLSRPGRLKLSDECLYVIKPLCHCGRHRNDGLHALNPAFLARPPGRKAPPPPAPLSSTGDSLRLHFRRLSVLSAVPERAEPSWPWH